MYEIEKGVQPPSEQGRRRISRYPLRDLKVGESFTAPLVERTKVSSTITHVRNATGRTFTTAKLDDKTLRVWRLS